MKKLLSLIGLLTLSITTLAQTSENKTSDKKPEMDFVVLEMKLGAILGGFSNGKFVDAKTAAQGLKTNDELALYGLSVGKNEGEMRVAKINEPDEICPEYYSVETDEKAVSGVALSSNASWNATPRIAKEIGSESKIYKNIVKDFLKTKGLKNSKISIGQVYQVDLDGDGQDEVIIRATNYSNFGASAKEGEYSFVLVREIVGKKVNNILLTGDFITGDIKFGAPERHEISAIADLDGDGKMEIIIYGEYYEGSWAEAYKITGGKADKILQTGCGV